MLKNDLKEISNLLDQKFKENNKKIFEKMDEMEEKIMVSTQKEFNIFSKRFDEINKILENKVDKNTLLDWADNRILDLELDRDKAKFLHIEKWKNLPSAQKINNALIKEGIK